MLQKTFLFLNELQNNNNREWYHANKDKYLAAKEEFEQFTEILIHAVSQFDKTIAGLQPKDCIFRIFRDVRFSNDKTPYKNNFGAFICKGGKKSVNGGYYIHVQPGNSFVAGGLYMPPSPLLKSIRREIFEHTEEFKKIIYHPGFIKHFSTIDGEKVKTVPQGFSKDFADIELLKYKSFTVSEMKADSFLLSATTISDISSVFLVLQPFIQFLNQAVLELNPR